MDTPMCMCKTCIGSILDDDIFLSPAVVIIVDSFQFSSASCFRNLPTED